MASGDAGGGCKGVLCEFFELYIVETLIESFYCTFKINIYCIQDKRFCSAEKKYRLVICLILHYRVADLFLIVFNRSSGEQTRFDR